MQSRQGAISNFKQRLSTPSQQWTLRIRDFGVLIAGLVLVRLLSIFAWPVLSNGDPMTYHRYALEFWTGPARFHSLPIEYPPLSIVPFSLTLLPPLPDYHDVFAFWMGGLFLLGYLGFLRFSTRRNAMAYAAYLLIGALATLLTRFDLVPALVTLAALWATQRSRFRLAYVLLAAGILLKLYPIFLVPVVTIEHWRAARARPYPELQGSSPPRVIIWRMDVRTAGRWLWTHPAMRGVLQGAGLCFGLVALGFLGATLIDPVTGISSLSYSTHHPLQVESTGASLLWIGTFFGFPAHSVFSSGTGIPAHADWSGGSVNYVGPLDVILSPLSSLALLGGCLWAYWRQAHGSLSVGKTFLACLCVVLATHNLYSPQHLIWVLPLVAAVEGVDGLWVAICLLSALIYPFLYHYQAHHWSLTFSWVYMLPIAIRNGLLVFVAVRAIVRPAGERGAHVVLRRSKDLGILSPTAIAEQLAERGALLGGELLKLGRSVLKVVR